jgi:hypothetical protein
MLCLSCHRQSICLVHQLADTNSQLRHLLEQLKVCEVSLLGTTVTERSPKPKQ